MLPVGSINLSAGEHCPGDAGELVRESDLGETERLLLHQPIHPVCHRRRVPLGVSHDGRCANDEQSPQIPVALFGYTTETCFASGRLLLRRQPKPGSKLPA